MTLKLIKDPRYPHVLIGQGSVIEDDVEIGKDVFIGYNCTVKEGVYIGDHVYISHLCVIAQGTEIEDDVFMGPGVITTNTKHISHGRNLEYTGQREPIFIDRGARIGAGVTILPDVIIGAECLIAAGSVVTKDCEGLAIYMGAPAIKTGEVPVEEWLP